MRKLKDYLQLLKISWQICPYLYFAKFLGALISTAQTMIVVFIPKYIIDSVTERKGWEHVLTWLVIFAVSLLFVRMLDLLTLPWRNACTNRADIDTVNHYMNLSANTVYEQFETNEYRNRLETVMGMIRGNSGTDFCIQIISALINLAVYAAFITALDPFMGIVIILSATASSIVKVMKNRLEKKTLADYKRNSRVFSYINDTLVGFDNAKEVRVNSEEELFRKKYDETIGERWKQDTYIGVRTFGFDTISHFAGALQIIFIYGYSGYKTWAGYFSLGTFSAYTSSVMNCINAVTNLVQTLLDVSLTLEYLPEYRELCAASESANTSKSVVPSEGNPTIPDKPVICFEDVCFRYPNTDKTVLDHINLTIDDGCKLAIVGENGSGKTTLVKLLCRLYTPTSGQIKLNGVNIEEYPREEYGRMLSVVFQDYKLFSFDIAENVVLNGQMDESKLQAVLAESGLDEKMNSLEKGIYTSISHEFDENGIELSGGEAQKLAIARAAYKNSSFVILDEPTASLDPKSEMAVYQQFQNIIGNKSAILISHRLASTRFCDQIIVLSSGEIVERGSHEELLRQKGEYAAMWEVQSELYAQKGQAE